ncbi:voltage-gated potassium channel KCNC1-like [Macrotis lagotis]|uniref:voltage-gated potassium channel KCNC1-like n=1 Tax=Macrotis lagotis TaxID=92651 RepID=UPI003D68C60E
MEGSGERLVLNVGGVRYETYHSTLRAFPGTRLYQLTEPPMGGTLAREVFFDRSPHLFGYVLGYYRTRQLHCPPDICRAVLEEELAFWGLADAPLAPCCWLKLSGGDGRAEDFHAWEESELGEEQGLLGPIESPNSTRAQGTWKPWLWTLLNQPCSSLAGKCAALLSMLFLLGVLVIFFQETSVQLDYFTSNFRPLEPWDGEKEGLPPPQAPSPGLVYQRAPHLLYLELLCVLWFGAELLARSISCPNKVKFLRSPMTLIDLASLFPVLVELAVGRRAERHPRLCLVLGALRVLYVLKLGRLLGLVEKPLALRVLAHTLRSSWREAGLLLLLWAGEILLFGSLFLYGELLGTGHGQGQSEVHFADILTCFWWTVITLTTVGYGDIYPMSALGQVTAAITAMAGMLTSVLLVPILLVRFQRCYAVALARQKLRPSGTL